MTTKLTVPHYISLSTTAETTGRSVRTLRRRISDGSLPAYRFGPRQIRVRAEHVQALARRIPTVGSA
ncbi:MAG: helix-turn-helix domain-containing protein [Actinomycetota bacterium]|nr:helix-turn-helix domain-containing protein [Actinomycetota bacterium]